MAKETYFSRMISTPEMILNWLQYNKNTVLKGWGPIGASLKIYTSKTEC